MKWKKILGTLLFVVGFGMILTPVLTNFWYNQEVTAHEEKFNETVKEAKDFSELDRILREENRKMFLDHQETFLNQSVSFETKLIDLKKYGLDEDVIGFLEVPKLGVRLPIYLGASWENMKLGAVHLTGTSYPIGGENTNSVIAAHRGDFRTRMFRHIDDLKIGDVLYIKNYNETLEYRAVKMAVIDPVEFDKLTIQENKDMVTILSCHPFPFDYQRYVVYFERSAS